MNKILVWAENARIAINQALDAQEYLDNPDMGLASLAPKYFGASASVLEETARVLRARALELRHPADRGPEPLPEDGASDNSESAFIENEEEPTVKEEFILFLKSAAKWVGLLFIGIYIGSWLGLNFSAAHKWLPLNSTSFWIGLFASMVCLWFCNLLGVSIGWWGGEWLGSLVNRMRRSHHPDKSVSSTPTPGS